MQISKKELQEKTDLCIIKYREAYSKLPNAVILVDKTCEIFNSNGMLVNRGEQKGAYLGAGLTTGKFLIPVYMLGRLIDKDAIALTSREESEPKLYKSGGICPLILTTQFRFYRARKIFGGKRFQNSVSLDVGVPIRQLEQQLEKEFGKTCIPSRKI